MKRHLCATVLFAVVLVPDWTAACDPRGGMMVYEQPYYAPAYSAPVYRGPVYYAAPLAYSQPVYVQPYVPAMPPPRVEVKPAIARPEVAPAPAKPPVVEPVRPAGGVDVPSVRPAKPEPAPAPEPPKRGGLFDIPNLMPPKAEAPKPPKRNPTISQEGDPSKVELPKPSGIEAPKVEAPKLPPIELPKNDEPKLPSIELPKEPTGPKLPSLDLPVGPSAAPTPAPAAPAVPSAAPAPESLIPAPNLPTPKGPDALPPLALPPDTPVAPEKTEVKSSPLSGASRELRVNVFPAAGTATAAGFRKIGFYNHTQRELSLTIEGQEVTLPAMSYLHAQLPPTFTWKCGDQPTAKATVPADAAGVDVLIRE